MRILTLLVVGIAITFTACSKKETNVVGSDSNPLETKFAKEVADIVVLKGEGKYESCNMGVIEDVQDFVMHCANKKK